MDAEVTTMVVYIQDTLSGNVVQVRSSNQSLLLCSKMSWDARLLDDILRQISNIQNERPEMNNHTSNRTTSFTSVIEIWSRRVKECLRQVCRRASRATAEQQRLREVSPGRSRQAPSNADCITCCRLRLGCLPLSVPSGTAFSTT
jgi:hypothetical protein